MATPENVSSQMPEFTDILKNIHFSDPAKLAEKETGQKIAKRIFDTQFASTTGVSNSLNFFVGRAAHWAELERWSLGKQDMAQFLPFMNIVDANKSYAKIDMTPIMLGAQFVGTKIESIAKNDEYPCVTAIDDDSMDEKEQRQLEALFRMKEVETINDIQQQAGIQLEPSNVYVPDDELSAKVYFELEDRLPKEIRFEQLLKNVLISNDYNRVIKPKLLRDNIVFNFECTKVEKEYGRKYCVRRCIPKNVFYNFFQSDSGKLELSYIGEGYNLKVKDIRSKYGKSEECPDGLTEQQIYDFAKQSAQLSPANPVGFNHQFSQQYSLFNGNTPWDDYSGYVIDFEIEVIESEYYVTKTDSYGKENISPKKGVPKPVSEKSTIQKKNKKRWYRGIYAPYANMMIYWGKPDLTILDYTDTERSFCSYSVNIPNNNGEYAPSLFERALEPLKEYALGKLKRKLLLSKLSPAAYRVDVESAKNITTGTGAVMEWEEIVRIKDTTGVELWSSKGLDPLTASNPVFSAATQDRTLNDIAQLSDLLTNLEAAIRVLLGVPVYLDGSFVGERTAAKLQEGQNEGSFNVTGFIPNGHAQVIEETLNKICILAWTDVVTSKKESTNDLINTRFKISVKMKMSDYERQILEDDIQRYSQVPDAIGNPSVTLKDAMFLRNIDDFKLAIWYLTKTYEENRKKASEEAERREKSNAEVQQQSLQMKAESDAKMQAEEIAAKKELIGFEKQKDKEIEVLRMAGQIASKGLELPDYLRTMINSLVPNIQIPLIEENKKMQQVAAAKQQQEMQEQMEQEQGAEDNPEEEGAEQQGQPMQQPQMMQ
jgi:hypothetical protein